MSKKFLRDWLTGIDGRSFKSPSKHEVICDHRGQVVFTSENVTYFAGGHRTEVFADLHIDLAGKFEPTIQVFGLNMKDFYELQASEQTLLSIACPDMGVPQLPSSFWRKLITLIHKLASKKGGEYKVLITCHGGHGRTGTALAILYGLEKSSVTPIRDIRGLYCKKAVESYEQYAYVNKILEINEK